MASTSTRGSRRYKAQKPPVPGQFLTDLARELGLNPSTLKAHAKRYCMGRLNAEGRLYLAHDEVRMVKAFYAPPPWPALTVKAAARMLRMTTDGVLFMVHRGRITAHKQGNHSMLKEADVILEMVCRRLLPPSALIAS